MALFLRWKKTKILSVLPHLTWPRRRQVELLASSFPRLGMIHGWPHLSAMSGKSDMQFFCDTQQHDSSGIKNHNWDIFLRNLPQHIHCQYSWAVLLFATSDQSEELFQWEAMVSVFRWDVNTVVNSNFLGLVQVLFRIRLPKLKPSCLKTNNPHSCENSKSREQVAVLSATTLSDAPRL